MNNLDLEQFETTIRTTVTLPSGLVERGQYFVEKGLVPSRNALIIAALERFLTELERVEIDRQLLLCRKMRLIRHSMKILLMRLPKVIGKH